MWCEKSCNKSGSWAGSSDLKHFFAEFGSLTVSMIVPCFLVYDVIDFLNSEGDDSEVFIS